MNQLLGNHWALGVQYRFTRSELETAFPQLPVFLPRSSIRADLHRMNASAHFNHPSGLFAQADARWFHQENAANSATQPGDDFFQINLQLGYRFPRRRADLTLGILNLADQHYHLNP